MNYCAIFSDRLVLAVEPLTYLLLFHQLRVRTIIYNVTTEDGGRENRVNILCICILVFSVEYEVVPLGAEADGRLLAEEDECKYVAILYN